jgi:hypothetical protein
MHSKHFPSRHMKYVSPKNKIKIIFIFIFLFFFIFYLEYARICSNMLKYLLNGRTRALSDVTDGHVGLSVAVTTLIIPCVAIFSYTQIVFTTHGDL